MQNDIRKCLETEERVVNWFESASSIVAGMGGEEIQSFLRSSPIEEIAAVIMAIDAPLAERIYGECSQRAANRIREEVVGIKLGREEQEEQLRLFCQTKTLPAPFSQSLYKRALDVAARAHGDQRTPHGLPYLVHLSSVAMEVMAALVPDRVAPDQADLALQCALLHDVLEDTAMTAAQLRAKVLAESVISGVLALTKDETLPKEAQMADSLHRLNQQPKAVRMVKLADRITNLDPPPPHWSPDKITVYAAEARQIYDHLHSSSPYLAERMWQRMADYRLPAGPPTGKASGMGDGIFAATTGVTLLG